MYCISVQVVCKQCSIFTFRVVMLILYSATVISRAMLRRGRTKPGVCSVQRALHYNVNVRSRVSSGARGTISENTACALASQTMTLFVQNNGASSRRGIILGERVQFVVQTSRNVCEHFDAYFSIICKA